MSLPRITDYEILEKLGVGSYASVYKARHKVSSSIQLFCEISYLKHIHSYILIEGTHLSCHQIRGNVYFISELTRQFNNGNSPAARSEAQIHCDASGLFLG